MLKHQRTLLARVSLRDEPNHLNFVLRECWVSQSSPAHYTADQKRRRERWSSRYKPSPCCCGISSHRIQYHFPWGSDQPLQILYLPPITALEPLAGCPSVSTCTQLCLLPALCSDTWHELQQHSLSPSRPAEPAHLLRCNSGEVSTL